MPYIAEPMEASRILGQPVEAPVYKVVRQDEAGNEIAVPVFTIKERSRKVCFKKGWKPILLVFTDILLVMMLVWIVAVLVAGLTVYADGPGYRNIEQTEDATVIALTEAVSEIYPVCPELLQAMVFYESGNKQAVISQWGDIGYMQINPKWHQERMDRLGVTDLTDGYSNILTGTDLMCELFQQYEDPALALMCYNMGPARALELYEEGKVSEYAQKILELSAELERLHGK